MSHKPLGTLPLSDRGIKDFHSTQRQLRYPDPACLLFQERAKQSLLHFQIAADPCFTSFLTSAPLIIWQLSHIKRDP